MLDLIRVRHHYKIHCSFEAALTSSHSDVEEGLTVHVKSLVVQYLHHVQDQNLDGHPIQKTVI